MYQVLHVSSLLMPLQSHPRDSCYYSPCFIDEKTKGGRKAEATESSVSPGGMHSHRSSGGPQISRGEQVATSGFEVKLCLAVEEG